MTRARQLAVYAAEDAALDGLGRTFRGPVEMQRYVDGLVASDWWGDRWPRVDRIAVGPSRSGRWSGYAVATGACPEVRLSSRAEAVLLHEIAHVVTPGAGHGPAFVDALLALVRRQMGFHAYGALASELRRGAGEPSSDPIGLQQASRVRRSWSRRPAVAATSAPISGSAIR